MKVYIPFNSNDFNSVFTTLSISPCSFYPVRKYSYRRGSPSIINNNEDFLIGFTKPIFHNREFDNDFGFPILLETIIDTKDNEFFELNSGIKYYSIAKTVFLTKYFKLLFRSEKEMNETFAKSLKSIETKYVSLAKSNSEFIKQDYFVRELPKLKYPDRNSTLSFTKERILNKIWGTILGSAIACVNSTLIEWNGITNQIRLLKNVLSLYLNKIGDNNDYEKTQTLEILSKINHLFENIQNLEESIMLDSNSNISSEVLNSLKNIIIFNIPVLNLLKEGLLASSHVELPISLKIEKLQRAINSKYNSKYPNNYIERINASYVSLIESVEMEIFHLRKNNIISNDGLVTFDILDSIVEIKLPQFLNKIDSEYLRQTIFFFIQTDTILDIEYFFSNKEEILTNLAIHFKTNIKSFTSDSKERQYIAELLKSFKSLRGGFQISNIDNEVLKTLAILFTSGRDFLRFIENNEKEQINTPIIYYSIWGSIYGASIFPKTQTQLITDNSTNIKVFISELDKIVDSLAMNSFVDDVSNEHITTEMHKDSLQIEKTEVLGENKISSNLNEYNSKENSELINLILLLVKKNGKIKLTEIKAANKKFKNVDDISEIIISKLSQQIILTKDGKTRYAIFKEIN
jgi:hypothetical protein